MRSIYTWSRAHPFHISVGVLLTNEKGEICAHHFKLEDEGERFQVGMGEAKEYYLLMRETIEDGETLEAAAMRGIKEEFGATGTMSGYLGCIVSSFEVDNISIEKTTLYFQVKCKNFDLSLRVIDGEGKSKIEWFEPLKLMELMEQTGALMTRTDRNESKIIKTFLSVKN